MTARLDSPETRAARIEAACKTLGISVAELARRLGKSRQYLYGILSGAKPGEGTWEPMATALGVDVVWLTTGVGNVPKWWSLADGVKAMSDQAERSPDPETDVLGRDAEILKRLDEIADFMAVMKAAMGLTEQKPPATWSLKRKTKASV